MLPPAEARANEGERRGSGMLRAVHLAAQDHSRLASGEDGLPEVEELCSWLACNGLLPLDLLDC